MLPGGLFSTQQLLIEDPAAVLSRQHAGLMHPFRYTTCTKHDSAYCNVTHRGRLWLHISRKMDDNSVTLWRHLPIKALHFSHSHIVPCLVCVTASLLIVCRTLITASLMSINYQSFNLNYIVACISIVIYSEMYVAKCGLEECKGLAIPH